MENELQTKKAGANATARKDKPPFFSPAGAGGTFFKPSASSIQRKCEQCKEKEKLLASRPSSSIQMKMPEDVQNKMENALNADFSGVNIHRDSDKAHQLEALAYTQGNDIFFAPGQYAPQTNKGQQLLGHELMHVVQQREGRVHPTSSVNGEPMNDDAALENEADQMGRRAAGASSSTPDRDRPAAISYNTTSSAPVQRTIDLSIIFNTFSLDHVHDSIPITGGPFGQLLRETENQAYNSFSNGNPVLDMSLSDTWYYYNPMFTNSVYASRSWWTANLAGQLVLSATDTANLRFIYTNTTTTTRNGNFTVSRGTQSSETQTLTGGVELTYGAVKLSGSASQQTSTGNSASSGATVNTLYEHGYNVALQYNVSYYNNSDFQVDRDFWGPHLRRVGGPHTASGTVAIGTCSVLDDDSDPDNLTR